MAYAGARGETATQMAKVLHLSGDPASVAQEFGTLLTDLNSAGQDDYALSVADALWGQQGVQFLSQFLDTMQTDYGGGLNQVDFSDSPEAVRQTINDWVAQHTNDKIQNLIPSGSIDTFTRLVLTNAIYFKGNWATAFDPVSTYDASFTLSSGANELVPTMHNTDPYQYMQSDGFQVVELPYTGGRLAMDVLLPSAGGTGGLSVSQLPSDLSTWLGGLSLKQVNISLPKFTLTTQYDLSDDLETLGMTDAFSGAANFSGMTDPSQFQISQVVHKAYIDVAETGTEAAGATGVIMTAFSNGYEPPTIPVEFNADHPFLFLIRDTQSGSVLFMGQEANPLQTGGDSSAPAIDPKSAAPPAQPPAVTASTPTLDVNRDGQVTPFDALLVINDLVLHGSHAVQGSALAQVATGVSDAQFDVNHDGMVTPFDALVVINGLILQQSVLASPTSTVRALSAPGPISAATRIASAPAISIDMATGVTLASTPATSPMSLAPTWTLSSPIDQPQPGAASTAAKDPQLASNVTLVTAPAEQEKHDTALALTNDWCPVTDVPLTEESRSP
jgi:serpin B